MAYHYVAVGKGGEGREGQRKGERKGEIKKKEFLHPGIHAIPSGFFSLIPTEV